MQDVSSSNKLLVRRVDPLPEGSEAPHRLEGVHNLDGIDDANASHTLAVVAAQQQAKLDELLPVHSQFPLYVIRPVLLHILPALKYVPAAG